MTVWLSGDTDADALLARDPMALLVAMLLDQQFPMERAFAGPYLVMTRLARQQDRDPGPDERLDAGELAGYDEEAFVALFAGPPAVHRYPAAMARRVQELSRYVVATYDGDAGRLWKGAGSGADLLSRARALPGYGAQKSQILVALLGKQFGVRPEGWREAAGAYGEEGSRRSIADVTGPDTLAEVRAFKKQAKAAKAAKAARR